MTQPNAGDPTSPVHNANQTTNDIAVKDDGGFEIVNTPSEDIEQESSEGQQKVNGVHSPVSKPELKLLASAPNLAQKKGTLDLKPPPIQTKLRPEEDSIAKSPALARFTIDRAYGDPSNTLSAMQMSPPRSSSKGSPEIKQTLPSLTTAIPDAGTPFSAHSTNLTRASPGQMYGPHSAISPPSLPSHPSFWKTNTRAGSISTPSDYAIVSASRSVSTPASSIVNQSTAASHPTPTTTSQEARPDRLAEQVLSPESDSQETNEISGLFSSNSYKCTILGCRAAPFQTPYLVNSHMNVHSDTRPYFCPVKRCARGTGGQGFKRKNEMIRHGLMHTSPGYMCPFCPDQQHKYPRPDNLQRHVRLLYVDKDRDDPLLLEVLAQRPEGGSRGRRRRLLF